jgi:hypothetical protein
MFAEVGYKEKMLHLGKWAASRDPLLIWVSGSENQRETLIGGQ